MKKFLVIKKEICPECYKGTAYDPTWDNFYEAQSDFRGETDEAYEKWTREWWSNAGFVYDKRPPESFLCEHCNGTGFIETEVPLFSQRREFGMSNYKPEAISEEVQ